MSKSENDKHCIFSNISISSPLQSPDLTNNRSKHKDAECTAVFMLELQVDGYKHMQCYLFSLLLITCTKWIVMAKVSSAWCIIVLKAENPGWIMKLPVTQFICSESVWNVGRSKLSLELTFLCSSITPNLTIPCFNISTTKLYFMYIYAIYNKLIKQNAHISRLRWSGYSTIVNTKCNKTFSIYA